MKNILRLILGTLLLSSSVQAYSPSYDPEYNCKIGDGEEVFVEIYLDNAVVSLNNNEEVYLLNSYGLSSALSVQDKKFKTKEGARLVSLNLADKKNPIAKLVIEEGESKLLDLTLKCKQLVLPD